MRDALLTKLRALGLPVNDEAQIHGPNRQWRVVDVYGRDNTPAIFSTVPMTEAATAASLYAIPGPEGYEVRKLSALTG